MCTHTFSPSKQKANFVSEKKKRKQKIELFSAYIFIGKSSPCSDRKFYWWFCERQPIQRLPRKNPSWNSASPQNRWIYRHASGGIKSEIISKANFWTIFGHHNRYVLRLFFGHPFQSLFVQIAAYICLSVLLFCFAPLQTFTSKSKRFYFPLYRNKPLEEIRQPGRLERIVGNYVEQQNSGHRSRKNNCISTTTSRNTWNRICLIFPRFNCILRKTNWFN